MTEDDRGRFGAALALLTEVLGGTGLSAPATEIYWRALRELPWPQVEQAFQRASVSCKFFPKPAELRELAGCGLHDEQQALEDRAERAWQSWRRAAQSVGAYASLYCEDGATARALESVFGGWVEAARADLSPEMWASRRKEWGRVYRLHLDAPPMRLPGQHEQDNAHRGYGLTRLTAPLVALALDGEAAPLPALPAAEDEPTPLLPVLHSQPSKAEAKALWDRLRTLAQMRRDALESGDA